VAPPVSLGKFHIADPEVWFRIVHITLDAASGYAEYRDQTVEVALGPWQAFENGNIGRLTRRVLDSQVVSAVPLRLRNRKPEPPKEPKTPRVVEILRKAIEWRRRLDSGEVGSQTELARREGVTRARITQILMLLRLSPAIQRRILDMPITLKPLHITERGLRPIACIQDPEQQSVVLERVIGHLPVSP
jgi:hypothetical protein